MGDELLPYYRKELAFIRKMGAEFAAANPKIAERLRIGPDEYQDPHVERLIEAFAYLTARIRYKLDDEFPEISDSLLGVLYPHYLAPVPSMAIAQFVLDRGQGTLVGGLHVARGAALEAGGENGACSFRTSYPVTTFPIEVSSATLRGLPFTAGGAAPPARAVASLRIGLRCFARDMVFSKLKLPALRFFIKGQEQHVFPLYELIFNHCVEVAILCGEKIAPVFLGVDSLRPVGFDADQGVLPFSSRSFPGYRLLSEYFAFPRKFLFFEISPLLARHFARGGNQVELCLYLNRSIPALEQNVSADMFRLGCTPIVNLYAKKSEPIPLTHAQTEYRIVPDARRPMAHEVYSVDRVTTVQRDGQVLDYQPFYSMNHDAASPAFWHATRRQGTGGDGISRVDGGARADGGTEVYLSLVDPSFSPRDPAGAIVDVETTCLNRDLPSRLPFGGGQPRIMLLDGGPVVIECLTQPTSTLRPALRHGARWQLISHLSLNHLSISDGPDGARALREILRLYDFTGNADSQSKIDSIVGIRSRRVVARAGGATAGGICRGVETTVELDEEKFTDGGMFLFAAVLERFMALYCSINSFSQLVITARQRKGEIRRWAPRSGEQIVL